MSISVLHRQAVQGLIENCRTQNRPLSEKVEAYLKTDDAEMQAVYVEKNMQHGSNASPSAKRQEALIRMILQQAPAIG